MTEGRMQEILSQSGALLSGHFLLASGQHTDTYIQCARVLQFPNYAEEVASAIADRLGSQPVDTVCAAAIGGILFAFELARRLGANAIFTERRNGVLMLRRGFTIEAGERVVIAADVVATGGSVRETTEIVREQGAKTVAVAALVDRGGGMNREQPFHALLDMDLPTWNPDRCPMCERGIGVVKPS